MRSDKSAPVPSIHLPNTWDAFDSLPTTANTLLGPYMHLGPAVDVVLGPVMRMLETVVMKMLGVLMMRMVSGDEHAGHNGNEDVLHADDEDVWQSDVSGKESNWQN